LFEITEDLFGRSVDATLSIIAYVAALAVPQPKSGATLRACIASEHFLNTVNYDVIKNALITAWKHRYIKRIRHALPEITEAGKRRLASVLPTYDETRTWDGRLHIVTYDIPEAKKKIRDRLRQRLQRIGCAKFQESVWITPYNPIDLLRAFLSDTDIGGTVIVSDLGRDASIGEETIEGLLTRIYHIKEINDRYEEWLERYENNSKGYEGLVKYLAILKDDPQLPFALLPKWWRGDKAYRAIQPLYTKLLLASRPRS